MCRDAQLHLPALQREEEKEGWRGGVKRKAGAQMERVKEHEEREREEDGCDGEN